jgi:hypothetical protein
VNGDRMSIKIVNDVPGLGEATGIRKGSALLVPSTTAAALVLVGVAVPIPPD